MQRSLIGFIRHPTPLTWIIFTGTILRILFVTVGAAAYYGKPDFWIIGGDTLAWFNSFLNLFNHGIYTVDTAIENGKFFRPPGYAFVLGAAYLLSGQQTEIMNMVLIWLQTLLDIVSIYLVYKVAWQASGNKQFSYIASFLYASYPFIIAWVPVLYAESLSVFFLLLSFYYFTKEHSIINCFKSAFILGIASLLRLQCLPVFGVMFIVLIFIDQVEVKTRLKFIASFALAFIISYGLWPLRNYFLQDRVLFTQDLNVGGHWSPDYFSMMEYLYTIQVDVQPQRNQVINKEKVTWPAASVIDKSDKLLLDSLSTLCITCGTGFSYFRFYAGLEKNTLTKSNNCDSLIAAGFNYLSLKQKQQNKMHYYLEVPMGNLEKALFKSIPYGKKSKIAPIVSPVLFGLRTLLIFFGIIGIVLTWRNKKIKRNFVIPIILYSLIWYFYMCFTFRQIEIRYFLHADVLLLFPAAYVIYFICNHFFLNNDTFKKQTI